MCVFVNLIAGVDVKLIYRIFSNISRFWI